VNKIAEQVKNGLIFKNPLFIQLLGMCSSLAVTKTAKDAIGMGIAVTAVLVFSNLFISILRKVIPNQIRIAAFIVIISGFVSMIELLIKAYLPDLDKSLGIFIPLIVVNCIILARAESFASKNNPIPSVIDGLAMGAGFLMALFILGSVREIIGDGKFFGISLFGSAFKPVAIVLFPAGAFITLGIIIAVFQFCVTKYTARAKIKKSKKLGTDSDIPEAEVTA